MAYFGKTVSGCSDVVMSQERRGTIALSRSLYCLPGGLVGASAIWCGAPCDANIAEFCAGGAQQRVQGRASETSNDIYGQHERRPDTVDVRLRRECKVARV